MTDYQPAYDDNPPTPDEIESWSDPAYDAEPPADDSEACSFLAVDTDPTQGPCPHSAEADRDIEGVEFPACPYHRERGGILHTVARRRLTLALVERRSIDANRRAVTDEGEAVTFARFCGRCGAGVGPGNTSGLCAECAEQNGALDAQDRSAVFNAIWPAEATACPPEYPFAVDRFEYRTTWDEWRSVFSYGARS